jgi:5S rRNA maturation endonuclease (ribonuclease M5)
VRLPGDWQKFRHVLSRAAPLSGLVFDLPLQRGQPMIDLATLPARTRDFIEHGAPEGQRQKSAFDAACQLRDAGATEGEALELVAAGAARCGLDLSQARGAVKSSYSRTPREPLHMRNGGEAKPAKRKIIATYDYTDEDGNPLFQCVRYEPKDFKQRRPDGAGGWIWKLKGVRLVLYRLPEVGKASEIWIVEGEKDADSLAALGFCATCNPMGAGKWRTEYTKSLRGKSCVVIADKDTAGRKHAEKVARSLHGAGVRCKVLELPGERVKDASDFVATFSDKTKAVAELRRMAGDAAEYQPMPTGQPAPDAMQAAIHDSRPKIRLPGDNWLMSSTAAALGQSLREQDIFLRNGEVCILRENQLHRVDAQTFRTWIENHCVMYRQKTFNESVYEVDVTLRDDQSRGILASPQFMSALRVVRRVNHARLPILRNDGRIELLPVGYDASSQTLTLPGVEYRDNMPHTEAVEIVDDLLREVSFTDARGKAVSVAAMVSLYVNQLSPERALRPCFVFVANAEGAGKTLLVLCLVTPTLGAAPTGCKADEDAEVRKLLLTAVREARPVLFIDNVKGRLSCEPLEAFLSAPVWSDRILGVSESFTADNLTTVFVTGNGMTVSPDMRRRSLFVELHLDVERAEDRQFKRPLDVPTLLKLRPSILAALWSLVRHWDTQGRPAPSRSHSAFPSWTKIVGGIVEAAGFGCPLESPNTDVAVVADVDGDDMRRLVATLERGRRYTFAEIVNVCQANGCFEGLVGASGDELKNASRVAMSRLLLRYERRLVGERRFQIEGKGRGRRYHVEGATNDARSHALHAVPADTGHSLRAGDGRKQHDERDSVTPEPAPATTTEQKGHAETLEF